MDVNWHGAVPALMTDYGSEYDRPPRLPLIGEERAKVKAIFRRAIETRPMLAA